MDKFFVKQVAIITLFNVVLCMKTYSKPNIVLIITDDQDVTLKGLEPLKNVQKLIGNEGVTFENAFVASPICCPSRSAILTGKYVHNVGVRNNSVSGNCSSRSWQKNHEAFSIASLLKHFGGYTTFYAGKYLNQYGSKSCGGTGHVPVGYDWWIGLKGNSVYYNYTLSLNGTGKYYTDEYLTDVLNDFAMSFLNQGHVKNVPFFMTISTPAAHAPFTPAPRHKDTFPNLKVLRTPSFNFSADDKHWLLSMLPKYLPKNVTILDNIYKRRWQTLLAVDEMVQNLIQTLKQMKVLDNTYIVFMSDHGFHLGQFTQAWDKRQPYETDIRIPLLIRGPNIKKKSITLTPVTSIDIAPTLLQLANITVPENMDGRSFLNDILHDPSNNFRERNILIEYFGEGNSNSVDNACPWENDDNLSECTPESWCKCQDSKNNTYACIRRLSPTTDFKFCRFYDKLKFIEAYDIKKDPYELKNIYSEMTSASVKDYKKTLKNMLKCQGQMCSHERPQGEANGALAPPPWDRVKSSTCKNKS